MALTQEVVLKQAKTFSLDIVTRLNVSNMGIADLGVISALQNLTYVNLSGNRIGDISQCLRLPQLRVLIADGNGITAITCGTANSCLQFLSLKNNRIASVGGLSGLPNLQQLAFLQLQGNDVCKENGFLEFVLNNTTIRTLNSMRIRLSNGAILAIPQRPPEDVPLEEVKVEEKAWADFGQLDVAVTDFDDDFGGDVVKLQAEMTCFWEDRKKEGK